MGEKRELLDTQECQLEELDRLHKNLNARKSKLELKVSHSEEKKESLDKDLVRKQQIILHLNAEHNSDIDSLGQTNENIQKRIETDNIRGHNEDLFPTTFLRGFDKHNLLKEDNELSNKISEYI